MLLTCEAEPDSVYTRFTSDAVAAFTAPVTEVAFFTVPNSAREEAKALIEDAVIDNTHPVITVGKSSGGAVGWGEFNPAMVFTASFLIPLNLITTQYLVRRTPATWLPMGSSLLFTESLDTKVSTITSNGGKPQNMPRLLKIWESRPWEIWVRGMLVCRAEIYSSRTQACFMWLFAKGHETGTVM